MTNEITPWIACDGKNVPDFRGCSHVDYMSRSGSVDTEIDVVVLRDCSILFQHTDDFSGDVVAWRPSVGQVYMKPTQGNVILDPMGNEYRFTNTSDKPVTITFGGSSHPVEVHVIPAAAPEMTDEEIESEERFIAQSVRGSDEPGIARLAVKAEPAEDKTVAVIGGVAILASDLAAIIAARQPAPVPNTTPLGILTVFNERADHRLGLWQGAME